MTQRELNRAVAHATGEDISTIAARGFSILEPDLPDSDYDQAEILSVDWDDLDYERIVFFPDRQRRTVAA